MERKINKEHKKEYDLQYQRTLKTFGVKVKPEYHQLISDYATKSGMPIRQLIIAAIAEYMECHPAE